MICFTESDAHLFVNTFRGLVSRAVIISSADVYRACGRLHRTEPVFPDPVPLTEDSPLRKKSLSMAKATTKLPLNELW